MVNTKVGGLGDNKNEQSTSWSLHLWNYLWDLRAVARFCQALRDCRWEKGSWKTTHLPTNGVRSWRMFFGTDSLLVCPLTFILDVKLDPTFWWFENSLRSYYSPIQLTLSMWAGSLHPECLQSVPFFGFFFKVIQNCFPLLSTLLSLPFSNQEIIIISIKLLHFLFLLVLTFVFFKIFLKYLLVKYQI